MEDRKWFVESGEPGFSPERNKAIVEASIKKYEAQRAKKYAQFRENLMVRSDALATWAKDTRHGWESGKPADRYFGRRMMAYLRGDTVRGELMANVLGRDTFSMAKKLGRGKIVSDLT